LLFIHRSPQKKPLIDRLIENELGSLPLLNNDNYSGGGGWARLRRELSRTVYLAHPLDGFLAFFGSIARDLMRNV
jgi:hypothetical protein